MVRRWPSSRGSPRPTAPSCPTSRTSIARGIDAMRTIVRSIIGVMLAAGPVTWVPGAAAQGGAAASAPDLSGVYYPLQQGRGGRPGGARQAGPPPGPRAGGPPPRPTQSAPVSDGRDGRSPDAPSLTPEYLARWETIRKSRMAGSYEFDNSAKCLPPGMPAMMGMAYGMEIVQTKEKVTFFSELNDALRRVYLDNRKPTQRHLDDPTYAGYSTGRWDGDTLVVETVALHPDSF